MQIPAKTRVRAPRPAAGVFRGVPFLAVAIFFAVLTGCASPGPPLPPSLKLPEIPAKSGLSGERAGVTVTVHWMTPQRTTDHLLIQGKVEAEICRELESSTPLHTGGRKTPQNGSTASAGAEQPCSPVVAKASTQPGEAGEAVDVLPTELASGEPRLLAYRVQLKNVAGRTAGPSDEVFVAAGDAPASLTNFRGHDAKGGVVLEWTAEAASAEDKVELERTEPGAGSSAQIKPKGPIAVLSGPKDSEPVRLRAGDGSMSDAGGTVDRSVEMGHTYSYTAWRERTVEVRGQKLKIRSAISPAVTVKVEDIFAPDAPAGLVAVPGVAGEGDAARSAIDLSWEPNDEPRIAGYRVYRRDDGGIQWRQVSGEKLLPVAAYHDADVVSGRRYSYRITAVGANGMESLPSGEAAQTAPTP